MPTMRGESVVIRILDRDSVEPDFNTPGIRDPAGARLDIILAERNEIFW